MVEIERVSHHFAIGLKVGYSAPFFIISSIERSTSESRKWFKSFVFRGEGQFEKQEVNRELGSHGVRNDSFSTKSFSPYRMQV